MTRDEEHLGRFGEQEQDEELEPESERGDLTRYLLLLRPLPGGVGGGVGRPHSAALLSSRPPLSAAFLGENRRASSVLVSVSELVLV